MRLLVTGDRNWSDYEMIFAVIKELHLAEGIEVLIHGDARGADRLAGRAARELGIPVLPFPAKWDEYGKAAGILRNQEMLDKGEPNFVVAFHDNLVESRGTRDMVVRALVAGLTFRLYPAAEEYCSLDVAARVAA